MPSEYLILLALWLCLILIGVHQALAPRPRPAHECPDALLAALAAAAGRLHDAAKRMEQSAHCAVRQAAQATRKQPEPAQKQPARTPEKPRKRR